MNNQHDTRLFWDNLLQDEGGMNVRRFHLEHDDGGRNELRVAAVAAEIEPVADGLQRASAVLVGRGAGVRLQGV